jgi:hypothetical protein
MSSSRRASLYERASAWASPGSADGQDSLAQRFPRQSLFVDVANDVPAGVALAQAHRFAAAIDARGATRLLHQPPLDLAPPVPTATHSKIQSLRSGGRPSWAASAR